MKLDLWLALVLMTLISTGLFILTIKICGKLRPWGKRISAIIAIALMVGFAVWLLDSRWLLTILPFQAALVYGNFLIPFSALSAGAIWNWPKRTLGRRLILILPLVALAYGYNIAQLMTQTPPCGNKWANGVSLQTRQSSCAAAAAATLLAYHGIETTEEEMAELCLTGIRGTYIHGLYRGLQIKSEDRSYKVKVRSGDIDDLREKVILPSILYVKLTKEVDKRDRRYARDWGWIVEVVHTVVLFGFTDDGRADIGDPGVGREFWNMQEIRDLWQGFYMGLEKIN